MAKPSAFKRSPLRRFEEHTRRASTPDQQACLIFVLALPFFILVVVYAATGALAATFEVGDNQIWSIPSSPSYYTDWAAGRHSLSAILSVGSIFIFNFNNGAHDVLEVTRANYDDCTTSNPIATYTTGPATVELTAAGTRYFICGVNGHCSAGQKMTLTVAAASTPSATPPSPTSSGAPTPPTTVASPPTSSTPGPSGSAPGVPGAAPSATLGTAAVAAPLR
ncbi:unnamed protein product [Spirodela intermedia]|uniref:Phytocyanin domain-containing protein n=1 Tax=Spirodela intermedia TaxID=51605 RepID=A0A7I8JBR3_SPIIN|nr:unnamed protein product [Spirodela intermedia]CAA6667185.1 unnamed protein product [Spirodela intermedia]